MGLGSKCFILTQIWNWYWIWTRILNDLKIRIKSNKNDFGLTSPKKNLLIVACARYFCYILPSFFCLWFIMSYSCLQLDSCCKWLIDFWLMHDGWLIDCCVGAKDESGGPAGAAGAGTRGEIRCWTAGHPLLPYLLTK